MKILTIFESLLIEQFVFFDNQLSFIWKQVGYTCQNTNINIKRFICLWDVSIRAVSTLTAQMWITSVILTQKYNNCILKMYHFIFY